VKPRKVALGPVNETHAQLSNGIAAGEQVLLLEAGQGRELLEKAGIKIAPPKASTQPAIDPTKAPPRPPQVQTQPPADGNGAQPQQRGQSSGGRQRGQKNRDGQTTPSAGEQSSSSVKTKNASPGDATTRPAGKSASASTADH
jgi:hypothetical protein